eukprot:scaffold39929_cov61-Phaeocystis_antarctica.AAC.3
MVHQSSFSQPRTAALDGARVAPCWHTTSGINDPVSGSSCCRDTPQRGFTTLSRDTTCARKSRWTSWWPAVPSGTKGPGLSAIWRAVLKSIARVSWAPAAAFASSSVVTAPALPQRAANIRGVHLLWGGPPSSLTLAPALSSSSTAGTCPSSAATCRAVTPSLTECSPHLACTSTSLRSKSAFNGMTRPPAAAAHTARSSSSLLRKLASGIKFPVAA